MSAVLEDPSIAKVPLRMPVGVVPAKSPTPLVDLSEGILLHRFTYDEYHAMIAHGIIAEDARAELLDGLVVDKMPKGRPHVYALQSLRDIIEAWLSGTWTTQLQDPVNAGTSAPEPDMAIVSQVSAKSLKGHPRPPDVPLIVEVADTSVRKDRGTKLRIYSAAGFENYWIIDLEAGAIITHARPNPYSEPPSYEDRHTFHRGESVTLELDGQILTIAVGDILPPAVQ